MDMRSLIRQAIAEELVPSVGPVSHHSFGVPFDTGALLQDCEVTQTPNGFVIEIGRNTEYMEWLTEQSQSRRGWVAVLHERIAANIAAKLDGNMRRQQEKNIE